MASYKVILYNSQNATLTPVADITKLAKNLRWSAERWNYEEISFTIKIDDFVDFCENAGLDGSVILKAKTCDIRLIRDGLDLIGGRVIRAPFNLDVDNGTIDVDARGYLDLLNDRQITKDYEDDDACDIARDIISTLQAVDHGDMGITNGNTYDIGVLTSRSYVRQNAMEKVQQLADDTSGGFDFWFDYDRKFYCAADMGSLKDDRTYKYPGNITAYTNPNDGSPLANSLTLIGSGIGEEALLSTVTDEDSAIEYGLHEKTLVYSSIENQDVLDSRSEAELERRKYIYNLPKITVNGQFFNPSEIWVGDRIPIQATHPLVNEESYQRIERIECIVDDNHDESFDLILDKQGVSENE